MDHLVKEKQVLSHFETKKMRRTVHVNTQASERTKRDIKESFSDDR